MRDSFSTYHPIVNFVFFALIVIFNVIFFNPIFLCITLVGAVSYAFILGGKKAKSYIFSLPIGILIISIVANMVFVHKGITILFYIGDSPFTLEALIYGALTGIMLSGVIVWFYCYNFVVTTDKFMYIFGKFAPKISLIFSMVLRFVPTFNAQTKVISDAQKCIGRDVSNGKPIKKIKHGGKIISIMTSWALENSIDTADSMKARGYGLPNRSFYGNFRITIRDKILFSGITILAIVIIIGAFRGILKFECYPTISEIHWDLSFLVITLCYMVFCLLPTALYIGENIRWNYWK